jgi:hypothetical protein
LKVAEQASGSGNNPPQFCLRVISSADSAPASRFEFQASITQVKVRSLQAYLPNIADSEVLNEVLNEVK